VFNPKPGERVCILIDLDDPRGVKDFAFLDNPISRSSATRTSIFTRDCTAA